MRRSQNFEQCIRYFTRFNFSRPFISLYFEILSYLACGEKIIRLASKNSVKLSEKSTSDFLVSLSDMLLKETLFSC